MNSMMDEDKRRRLVAQIEATAEKIRQSRMPRCGVDGGYEQLFLLHPRNSVYSEYSEKPARTRVVFAWFLVVVFLISAAVVILLLHRSGIV